mgnify:FL=1
MKKIRQLGMMFILVAVCLTGGPARAQQKFENLDRIDGLVATTVGANIGEQGGAIAPVDRRLHLAACPAMPEVTGPMFGAAIVTCTQLGWRIRVPLAGVSAAAAQAAGMQTARPATRPIAIQNREIIIHKGDPVQLVAGGVSFMATRAMIADEDGAAGQMIRVREDKKSDPVIAQVVENGIVRAPGFKEF